MKVQRFQRRVEVSDVPELSAATVDGFRNEVRAALPERLQTLEIDLSQTRYLDGSGLGALFAVYQAAGGGAEGVTLRLVNPLPPVRQLLELTQLHELFEIVKR